MAIKSLKSYYLISTSLLLLLIVLILSWASYSVKDSSDTSLDNVNNRRAIQLSSSQIRDGVWETDFNLNAYLLTSSTENKEALHSSLTRLAQNIELLANNVWSNTVERHLLLSQLHSKQTEMHQNIEALIVIREDQNKRFPTLPILRNTLYPANLEFVTMTSLALEDMPLTHLTSDQAEFYRLLADTQRIWHRMISSFRLFVAYRTETINNPVTGMKNEFSDIKLYFSGIRSNLQQISKLKTGVHDNDLIDELIYISENWYDNFKVVGDIYTSDEWRKDDAIIRERLQPLSQDIRSLLYKLDIEIGQSVKLDVQSLANMAQSIILRIWLLGFIIFAVIIIGYFYLRNRVLNPISQVADGLLLQSENNQNVRLPVTNTREVNTLVSAFNHLSESLAKAEAIVRHSDKMSTVGQLASGVAHEINNPLNNIARVSEFIEEEINDLRQNDSVKEDFKILHREIDRCATIVKNLLDFGKPSPPEISSISIEMILDEGIQLLKHKALDKQLTFTKQVSDDLPNVYADPSQIHQVFVNLLLNAVDFSPAGDTIRIEIKLTDVQNITCRIIDNGPGADESAIEKLFDPFYTTRQGHEGTGLGLSVCYGIVKHHHGDIGAYAGDHGGLVVWFSLPVTNMLNTSHE